MRLTNLIFHILLLSAVLFAQAEKDSLDLSTKSYKDKLLLNNFDKQLNTYNFSTHVKYNYSFGNIYLGIKEIFNSTIIKTATKNIKDEQNLKLFGQYDLSEKFKFGLFMNNYMYSDDRSLAINKVSYANTSLFVKLKPVDNFEITPFGGLSTNKQIGETNNGFYYGSEANIDHFEFDDFGLSSLLRFQNEDISPRKNTLRLINLNLSSSFEENLKNNISASFASQRRDFYFTADETTAEEFGVINNIQSRFESNYFLDDKIRFLPANSPFTFDIQGRVAWRDIERTTRYVSLKNISSTDFDSRIKEFKIDFLTSADYRTDDLNLSFKFSFTEKDEKHTPRKIDGLNEIIYNERDENEAQKNNTSQFVTVVLSGITNLSAKDRLTLSIFHRKLIYDTPSEMNFDDRDELLSIGRVLYERKFSTLLKTFINLEGSFNKIVYIFSERSSNNNVQRLLKLSSGGIIEIGKLRTTNSAEVSANYTVFDYEELNPNSRSYSFRQFVYRDSSSYRFSKNFRLFFTGYIKLSEQGDFKWSNFTGKPLRYLDEKYAEPKLIFEHSGLTFGIGIRYFSLSTFTIRDGTQKEKISDYISIGPLSEISYTVSDSITFQTYGWYEFITSESNTKRELANFNLKLLYRL